jgi:hypothetical protein
MAASAEAAMSPGEARTGMPDFFIVGNPKSGTTALYEMLRRHPEIFMPELKEPWFFATDMRARFQPPMAGPPPETIEEYLALFSPALPGQRVGEASSSYLWSSTAARAIAQQRPDARIIAILREPASFLRSLHLQLVQTHVETEKDLARALALEGARREGRKIPRRSHRPQLLLYSNHLRYVEQLRRYHAAFSSDQVLVLIYEDFRRDNEATLKRVLRFLDVEESLPLEVMEANPTVRMRSQQLDDLVHAVSVGRGPLSRAVKAGVKALTPQGLRSSALRTTQRHLVHAAPKPADERLLGELRRRYQGEVRALSEYLDRDLVTLWGYDGLD